MNEIRQRIKNLSPDKVDVLLKQLRPSVKLQRDVSATVPARGGKRLFRESQDQNFYLTIDRPGNLDSLSFKTRSREALDPNFVEIEVEAACLNLRDVAISLGIYPAPPNGFVPELGCDGAGRIVAIGRNVTRCKVGDEVFFLANCSTFAKFSRAHELQTFLKPASWSFEEAAGLALIFITVAYSLRVPGRLRAGERILIHSAAGGIGLAAIQMARTVGAEIYATVGTEEKRAYLQSIGVNHIMDSRSLSWVDEIRRLTNGEGVDVVLNSLSGVAIDRGLSVLRPHGRFVELGKRDLAPGRMLDLAPFQSMLVFATVDISQLYPERLAPILDALRMEVLNGTLQPLPTKLFPASQLLDAFRFMTTGTHLGRIAVKMKGEPTVVSAPQ